MKVKPKEKIFHEGVWYTPGQELPKSYEPQKKETTKKKSEVK